MAAMAFVRGALVGAGLMYWLDPSHGRRRRAVTRQKLSHTARKVSHGAEVVARDASHRTRGLIASATSRVRPAPVDDNVLQERVRAKIGRASSHPGALEIVAEQGRILVAGPILHDEVAGVLRAIKGVPGVREVESRLAIHDEPGDVPSLQGGGRRAGGPLSRAWPPATQGLVAAAGLMLFSKGLRRRGLGGAVEDLLGAGLVTAAAAGRALRGSRALEGHRRGVSVRKTINVNAPVEEVFKLWRHFEAFPRFMTHVEEVRPSGEGRWHWKVIGPAGTRFEWDAEVTEVKENEWLAWRSVEGASIENAGRVRFVPNGRGGTQVDVQLSYHPPGGVVGHGIAMLLGSDPKRQMDDDLIRFKSLVEQGKATGRDETVTREEVEGASP